MWMSQKYPQPLSKAGPADNCLPTGSVNEQLEGQPSAQLNDALGVAVG
jgi:hypothetical protein